MSTIMANRYPVAVYLWLKIPGYVGDQGVWADVIMYIILCHTFDTWSPYIIVHHEDRQAILEDPVSIAIEL